MAETFDIPVTYKGQDMYFHAKLVTYGYSYKIQVDVFGEQIIFEQDEEKNYRVVLSEEQIHKGIKYDINLLKTILEVIESVRERD